MTDVNSLEVLLFFLCFLHPPLLILKSLESNLLSVDLTQWGKNNQRKTLLVIRGLLSSGIHRQPVAPLYDGLVSTSQTWHCGLGARSWALSVGMTVLVMVIPVVAVVAAATAAAASSNSQISLLELRVI